MSEYQYYELLAVDRPLDGVAQAELRAISSRARISSTSFVNSYDWGDLKADPLKLLERHFDVFVYLANWGTRRLALRLPRKHFDPASIAGFDLGDLIRVRTTGSSVILHIERSEAEPEDWDDGSGWMGPLAPLRADLLDGDLRLFHLMWVMGIYLGEIDGDTPEPIPGPGPLSAPLAALAEFLGADGDLLAAAYGTGSPVPRAGPDREQVRAAIAVMPDEEKVSYLLQLYEGNDPHLALNLRKRCRKGAAQAQGEPDARPRTAGDLQQQAEQLRDARLRAAEERAAAERRRREAEEAQARARRLRALAQRGDSAWRDIEELITLRNRPSYDRAAALLADLRDIAAAAQRSDEFTRRVAEIGTRHSQKRQFISRLVRAGILPG